MKLALEHLPASIRRLAGEIGQDAALALVLHHGGQTLWPSRTGVDYEHLVRILGRRAAEQFVALYREPYRVPLCRDAVRVAAHAAIRAEFDRLTREEGLSANKAVSRLVNQPPMYHAERHIWHVLKGAGVELNGVVEVGQAELF